MFEILHDFLYSRKAFVLGLRALCMFVGAEILSGHMPGGANVGAIVTAFGVFLPSSGFGPNEKSTNGNGSEKNGK